MRDSGDIGDTIGIKEFEVNAKPVDIKTNNKLDSPILKQAQEYMPNSIYRLGRTDTWACYKCREKGDIWYMKVHFCKGSKDDK